MALDEAIIAKLALFERCTSEEPIREFNSMINAAPDGKSGVLSELEFLSEDDLPDRLPKDWQKHADFVADWLKLDPPLGGIDLRPAIYLSRETLPLRVSAAQLGPKTRAAVEVLLKTATMNSRASKAALDEVDPPEAGEVMDTMIAVMSRNPDWATSRNDIRSASMLAKRFEAAHEKLVRFVAGIPNKPRWLTALMKGGGDDNRMGLADGNVFIVDGIGKEPAAGATWDRRPARQACARGSARAFQSVPYVIREVPQGQ